METTEITEIKSSSAVSIFGQDVYLWVYGKRRDKRLQLFPLSMADQLSLTKLIVELFGKVSSIETVEEGSVGNATFVSAVIDVVGENLERVVALVADLPADDPSVLDVKSHITNDQLLAFVEYVWETNYAALRKNYSGLFDDLSKLTKGPTA